MTLKSFSKKQTLALTWWAKNSDYENFDAIICDGSIRSGKIIHPLGLLPIQRCRVCTLRQNNPLPAKKRCHTNNSCCFRTWIQMQAENL